MPTMLTFQARRVALTAMPAVLAALAALTGGCSREQQDWRSAEGAGTTEAWARFIEQHPESELVSQARARIAELAEARDWQRASGTGTVAAYREFLARHPSGPRAEDARIRIEAFSLGSAPRIDVQSPVVAAAGATSGVPALQIANGSMAGSAAAPQASASPMQASATGPQASEVAVPAAAAAVSRLAVSGEAAQPMPATAPAADAAYASAASSEAELSSENGYGVQLGAFGSEASADREWQRLQGRFGAQLGGLSPRIILTSSTSGQLYRLQVAASGEAQARAICDSLKEQAQPCVPVLPQPR
jgi:hypothetical protein